MHKFSFLVLSLACGVAAVFLASLPVGGGWPLKKQIIFALSCAIVSSLFMALFQAVFKQDPVTYITQVIEENTICVVYDFEHCIELRQRAAQDSSTHNIPAQSPEVRTNTSNKKEADGKSSLSQPNNNNDICANLRDPVVKVRLVPALANFQQTALSQLERNMNCERFYFSSGQSGRFPDEDMNALAYSGVLDYKSISFLISKIRDMGINVRYVCNNVHELYDNYVLLAHYNYAGDRPLSAGELNILINPDSKSSFDTILGAHVCHGPWPIAGPAARK